jgi:hypothetical protein
MIREPPQLLGIPPDFSVSAGFSSRTIVFAVHRAVLASASTFFAQMMQHCSSGEQTAFSASAVIGSETFVSVDDDPAVFSAFLRFAYHDPQFDTDGLMADELGPLLDLADKYEATSLHRRLVKRVAAGADPTMAKDPNYLPFYYLAVSHHLDDVVAKATKHVVTLARHNFDPVLDQVQLMDSLAAFKLLKARREALEVKNSKQEEVIRDLKACVPGGGARLARMRAGNTLPAFFADESFIA